MGGDGEVLRAEGLREGLLAGGFCLLIGQDFMCKHEMIIDYHRKEMFFKHGGRTYRVEISFSLRLAERG